MWRHEEHAALMVTEEIRAEIAAVENNRALYEEGSFGARAEAIDDLERAVIDRIEGLLQTAHPPEELAPLRQRAEWVRRQLEAIDAALFRRLRSDIRAGGHTGAALKGLLDSYVGRDSGGGREQGAPGYDNLDVFVNGLLGIQAVPAETKAREPEMVPYQAAPARIILELVERAQLRGEDVFYDLGSGLGRVPILVNLLSGATARGIEFEPAYCELAGACAADLNLSGVTFINGDARAADYSEGTTFFLYTPFEGRILQDVLERLRGAAGSRAISVLTYGPCTPQVARQRWLGCVGPPGDHRYSLAMFKSL